MAQLITILWRDIPAQVTAKEKRRKVSVQLSDRFQIAIDRAAVVAGKETTDDYLGEWHRTTVVCGADLAAEADRAAAALEETFTEDVLRRCVRTGGLNGTSNEDSEDL